MTVLEMVFGGAGSAGQLIGALVMVSLYVTVGVFAAVGSISIIPRFLQGVHQMYFWAAFLAVIALFYAAFGAYFDVTADVWRTELLVIVGFLVLAGLGLVSRPVLALGYLGHAAWDMIHSLYGVDGFVRPLSEIPLGYGIFCLSFDVAMAVYIWRWKPDWSKAQAT